MDDIPRCYYNIFFIYYDKFSLEVQPISEFPASVNCPSLFRFGFDLEAEIWEYFLQTDKTVVLANERRNCGFPGITKVTKSDVSNLTYVYQPHLPTQIITTTWQLVKKKLPSV